MELYKRISGHVWSAAEHLIYVCGKLVSNLNQCWVACEFSQFYSVPPDNLQDNINTEDLIQIPAIHIPLQRFNKIYLTASLIPTGACIRRILTRAQFPVSKAIKLNGM